MPRVVIGSTLVSLATTTPEMTVSVFSGLNGQPGLAVGNAVGSSVCNLLLILGAMAMVKQLEVHPRLFRFPFLAMGVAGILLFALTAHLHLSRWQGLGLILLGAAFFAGDFLRHRRQAAWVAAEAAELDTEFVERHRWLRTLGGTSALFLLGAVLVVGGSRLVVDAGVRVAEGLGVPPMILGLTLLAVGTSLPELVTAISSARQDVSDLAIGNLLGANIANLTLIVGSAAALHDVAMDQTVQRYNFSALLCSMVLVGLVGFSGRRVTGWEGLLLLGSYALYLIGVISLSFVA
jgi:cation:H+ antiporter